MSDLVFYAAAVVLGLAYSLLNQEPIWPLHHIPRRYRRTVFAVIAAGFAAALVWRLGR